MKKTLLLKTTLLLCALIVGSSSMWAQSDYSASYTGNITLSTTGGTSASDCKVKISGTEYNGIKAGTGSVYGALKITIPQNTKYLHLHVAAWNGDNSTSLVVTPNGYSDNVALTANSGIANATPFTFGTTSNDKSPNSTYHYKVITFTTALTANTELTFTASGGKRFVVWGVYAEAESNDPSSGATFTNETPSINYPAQKTYSQAPKTAEGYTGTITYSITDNTAGATINSSTGVVTVTQGGSVTVKAIAPAVSGSFSGSEASYTLTVNDTRTALGDKLAWSAASATVTYGADNNVFPTLTNTENVPVTYDSSNQAAATIDANTGVITLKDVKTNSTTIISAIFAGNDDYISQTVQYTLTVNKAPFAIKDGVFDFVEAAKANPVEDYGSGVTLVSTGFETESKTWTAGNVTMVTSRVSGNGYRWWEADGTLRFYNKSTATFSVPSGYVITKIVTTGANFDEANVGSLSSSTWTGASNEVALSATGSKARCFEKITVTYTTATQTATVKSYGWATYIPDYNVEFDPNTAYVVTDASLADGLTLAPVTNVPAGTPLLLKGAGEKSATVIATASAPSTNLLSKGNGTIPSGKYPYVLAKNGEGACFKQWTGDASVLNGRVVLYLDEAVATSRSIFELDDETTGIEEIRSNTSDGNGAFFDLQGRKVANPTKGLYIVNGKKAVIK